ncbi:6-phosphogluconolactonase [Pseudolysobacter antarcticus]|uniref:6-phosphogluconolactonase n=1 Tax=Pseudolysobacter antarcticus TaxID=2511995 RepID=UPI001F5D915E|nr:6-phosphogluconolactonase [Pseudolysobacter antarcticus]
MAASTNYIEQVFDSAATLANALAQSVADDLRRGLSARNTAVLALSGGTTPREFLRELSQQALDWSRVTVTLVDERWVGPDDERSNARLLRENLLKNRATNALFVPLYCDAPDPETGLPRIAARIAALPLPFDAVVLGLGEDGHTASFFPGGDHLAHALDVHGTAQVLSMRAPDAGEPRITLSMPTVLNARAVYLHIQGDKKRAVLAQVVAAQGALATSPMRVVLDHATSPIQVFWCA